MEDGLILRRWGKLVMLYQFTLKIISAMQQLLTFLLNKAFEILQML